MCDKALLMYSECGGESAFNIFSTGLVERWQESIYIFQVSLSIIIKSMACFFVFLKKTLVDSEPILIIITYANFGQSILW